jgi:cation:H+ antiporter
MTLKRELPVLLLVTLIGVYFLSDNYLSQTEGVILITLFVLVLAIMAWLSLKVEKNDPLNTETADEIPSNIRTIKAVMWVVIGLVMLPLSAHFLVESAVYIARFFGVSDLVIGLTIIALGTSLPELAASIAGVRKGEDDLVIGNIIGSNIFNILAVLAMPGLIIPSMLDINVSARDSYAMLGVTILLFLFCFNLRGTRRINRYEGGILVMAFLFYQYWLFK